MRYFCFLLSLLIFSCSSRNSGGESLVYLKSVNGNFDLYQSDLLGQWEKRITSNPGWDWSPRWNNGLNQLVYYSQDTADNFEVFARSLNQQFPDTLPYGELLNYQLSPDAEYIYFSKKVGAATNIKRRLKDDPNVDEYLTYGENYHGRLSISNDHNKIAFISNRNGSNQLYVRDLKSGKDVQLTKGPMIAKYNSFSPDAQKIAVTLAEPSDDPIWDIYIIDVKTLESIRLTDTPYSEQEIAWSLSGKKIAFHGTSEEDGDQIYTIDIADGKFTKITSGDFYHGEPAWIPREY